MPRIFPRHQVRIIPRALLLYRVRLLQVCLFFNFHTMLTYVLIASTNAQAAEQCVTQTMTVAAQPTYSPTEMKLLNKTDKHQCTGGQKYSSKKKTCTCFGHSTWNGTQCVCNTGYKLTTRTSKKKKTKYLACTKIKGNATTASTLSYVTTCSTATASGASPTASVSSVNNTTVAGAVATCGVKQVLNATTGQCECIPGAFKGTSPGCFCAVGATYDASAKICKCRPGEVVGNRKCVYSAAPVDTSSNLTTPATSASGNNTSTTAISTSTGSNASVNGSASVASVALPAASNGSNSSATSTASSLSSGLSFDIATIFDIFSSF